MTMASNSIGGEFEGVFHRYDDSDGDDAQVFLKDYWKHGMYMYIIHHGKEFREAGICVQGQPFRMLLSPGKCEVVALASADEAVMRKVPLKPETERKLRELLEG